MNLFTLTRQTIYQVPKGLALEEYKSRIPDAGRRRHLCFALDFDMRATTLKTKIENHWEDKIQFQWHENQQNIKRGLIHEFGELNSDAKIENFEALGTKPMSILAYHNAFFKQARDAFVMGQYYPALVGACALGERILNHLVLDMRPMFTGTQEYKRVSRNDSFDNWCVPIKTLEAWGILLPEAVTEFRALKTLRHRSIHFNVSTYKTLREDALAAILHMRTIIDCQFGAWGPRPWFIKGTIGHMFVAKSYEFHPIVRTYYAPQCAFVGPLFGMRHGENGNGWEIMDVPDYGDGDWTDEEFAQRYNERDSKQVMKEPPCMEWAPGAGPSNERSSSESI
jgi:hypothetical protein